MATLPTFTSHIRNLIAKDDFATAIQELCALLKNSPHLDEAILHSARYNDITRQIRLGVVDFEAANVTKNQIRYAILELLKDIEERGNEPNIKAEVERYVIKIEKNVVKDSTITAGGNVNIGDTIHTESKTSRNLRLFLYVFVPTLAISIAYLIIKNKDLTEPLNLTVVITDKTPNPNIPFDKAKVTLTYGDKTETQTVEKEATFKGIPPTFKGKKVALNVESEGFVAVNMPFVLTENKIDIALSRNNSLGKIFGLAKDDNGKPLADVQISVQDISVMSDASGRFTLTIPFDKQRKFQRVKAFRQGFKLWEYEMPVIENEELPIILKQ